MAFTKKRIALPNYTGDARKDFEALKKAVSDYLLSLEAKQALLIDQAQIDGTPIGSSSASTGKFTTLQATTSSTFPTVTYTPTVTAGTGTFTTVSAVGKATKIGDLWFVNITVTVTTNGTAATNVQVTLPPGLTASARCGFQGRENGTSGKALAGDVLTGQTTLTFANYDNTYPAANGSSLNVFGIVY